MIRYLICGFSCALIATYVPFPFLTWTLVGMASIIVWLSSKVTNK